MLGCKFSMPVWSWDMRLDVREKSVITVNTGMPKEINNSQIIHRISKCSNNREKKKKDRLRDGKLRKREEKRGSAKFYNQFKNDIKLQMNSLWSIQIIQSRKLLESMCICGLKQPRRQDRTSQRLWVVEDSCSEDGREQFQTPLAESCRTDIVNACELVPSILRSQFAEITECPRRQKMWTERTERRIEHPYSRLVTGH